MNGKEGEGTRKMMRKEGEGTRMMMREGRNERKE